MKNPIIKKLIVIGIRKNDEKEYFENPNSFIDENTVYFPLNTVNNIEGIYLARFENFMKLHYIQIGKKIRGKYIFQIYNYDQKKFINIDQLLNSQKFIALDQNYFGFDQIILVRVKVQIFYNEYREIQAFLKDITKYNQELKSDIKNFQLELDNRQKNLKDLHNEMWNLKKVYPSLFQYQQVDIAFLYSHPIISYDKFQRLGSPVSYFKEIVNIKENVSKLNKYIKCLITQATRRNLQIALKCDPKILHIMSHGDVNEQKGTFLQFEAQCFDDPVFTKELEYMIQSCYKNLKLVILSCCHSGEIAKMISQYAPTIAVDAKLKMLDEAGVEYSGALYEQLVQNNKLNQSHEEAKKRTQENLQKNNLNSQCCCSHSDLGCRYKKQNNACYFHYFNCDCKYYNDQNLHDTLRHKWEDNNKCAIKDQILDPLNQEEKVIMEKNLNKIVKNGSIRVCCCELTQLLTQNEITKPLEHTESEKFQIFGERELTLNLPDGDGGKLEEINKIPLQEQLDFVGWKMDTVKLYLEINNQEKLKKLIILNILDKKIEDVITMYAEQVCKYYIQRKIKFYDSDIEAINISKMKLEQLGQQNNEDYAEKVQKILIINEMNHDLYKQKESQFLEEFNKSFCVIIIAENDFVEKLTLKQFEVINLKDWNDKDSQKLLELKLQNKDQIQKAQQILGKDYNKMRDILETIKVVEQIINQQE